MSNTFYQPVCQLGVFNEGHSSSVAIGVSKECKQVFNKACTMPWRHTVVRFEAKTRHFEQCLETIIVNVEEHLQSKQAFFHGDFQCVKQD